ncbi:MAG: hypothetical protein LW819_12115 [Fimbriimonadaceae bacterium]|jgi:hypothetical protein|nr:hypothetical protein [Fimbriimonadaceae bacterium]
MARFLKMLIATFSVAFIIGCSGGEGANLETTAEQPPADLEAGKNANTLEEWSKANPNNGAPGHGDMGAGQRANTDK